MWWNGKISRSNKFLSLTNDPSKAQNNMNINKLQSDKTMKYVTLIPCLAVALLTSCTFPHGPSMGGAGKAASFHGILDSLPDQTMDASLLRVKDDVAARIAAHAFIREKYEHDWRFGLDIGDGDFGAAIYGTPQSLRFEIGKNDITIYDRNVEPSYPAMSFAECRKQLDAGNPRAVWKAIGEQQKAVGPGVNFPNTPGEAWGGRLTLDLVGNAKVDNYREKLDLLTAEAQNTFTADGREASVSSFVSQEAEVAVIHTETPTCDVFLSRNAIVDGWNPKKTYRPVFAFEDGIALLRMTMPSGDAQDEDRYVIALACDAGLVPSPAQTPDKVHEFSHWTAASSGKPVNYYFTVVSSRDVKAARSNPALRGKDIEAVAKSRLRAAMVKGRDTLRREHQTWWRNYWNRAWVMLEEKEGEYPWYFSLYKAGSARRPGKVGPAYCAPWRGMNRRGQDNQPWSYLILNYEMIHRTGGIMVTNHGEEMEPYVGTLWDIHETIARNTKSFYGMDGLCYPHSFSQRGNLGHYSLTGLNVGTSGQAVQPVWSYYEFTQDKEYLRQIAYPLLRGVAEFQRQYLREEADGKLHVFPSYFTEATNFLRDSLTDQVAFRETFACAAQAADDLGVDADKAKAWREAAARMAPLAMDKHGWLMSSPVNPAREAAAGKWRYGYGLITSPIYPGNMVNCWHGTEELREQAEITYKTALGGHPDAWDKSYSYLVGARMGDRDYYLPMLKHTSKRAEYGDLSGNEFRSYFFNVDAGSPFPAGVVS